MRKIITSNKGFSLIELMVVVAIIGVLSAIGIPQYTKFQARARQSEAKAHLSALFTSETSFQSEWNVFTTDLLNVGFAAVGTNLRYTAGFTNAACANYVAMAPGAPAENIGRTQLHKALVTPAASATWHTTLVTSGGFGAAATVPMASACDNAPAVGAPPIFTAIAVGEPRSTVAAATDRWSINQAKNVANTFSGL